jgi:hypothetical protein
MSNIRVAAVRITFILLAMAVAASAQLTVINTPSTDIQPAKTFYLELDFAAKLKSLSNGGFQNYGYRTVYGINRNYEAGVSLFYTRSLGSKAVEAQFSLKRKLYTNEKHGLASAAGITAYVPINKDAGTRTVAFAYGNFSKIVERANGLRVTAGVYRIINGGSGFGTKTGMTLAVEQPVFKRVTIIGDWITGKNRFGYASAGLTYNLTTNQTISATYNFSNIARRDNYLYIFYSYTF